MLFRNASIDKITAFVKEYERSHRFYRDVLGLTVAWEAEAGETENRNAGFRIGNNLIIIQEIGESMNRSTCWIVSFTINGIEEARDYLVFQGVECGQISEQEDFKFMRFEDPDGNQLGIMDPTTEYQMKLGGEYLQRAVRVNKFSRS